MLLLRFRISLLSLSIFAGLLAGARMARAQDARPKITGISHMAIYTSDPAAAEHFYGEELGAAKESDPENPQGTVYRFSSEQFIEVLPLPAQHSISRLDHVAFATTDAAALHAYLIVASLQRHRCGHQGFRWQPVVLHA